MATGTVLDERSRKALQQAIDDGMETFEQMAERMGIPVPEIEEEDDTPHWSSMPPEEPEPWNVKAARYTWKFGFGALAVIDYCGEWLAKGLGITTPKYQYIIDELADMQEEIRQEEEEERAALEEARAMESQRMKEMEAAADEVDENGCSSGGEEFTTESVPCEVEIEDRQEDETFAADITA